MTKQYIGTAVKKGETVMTEYIEREEKCGDCIHVEVCERIPIFTEFSRENPAYCKNFMKAADVVPVRHGRWEVGYFHDRVCSCCLHPDNDLDDYAHNFCPHCGADMSKEDEDE